LGIEETEDGFKIIIRCPIKAVKATLPAAALLRRTGPPTQIEGGVD
jgi:hypothetical protein